MFQNLCGTYYQSHNKVSNKLKQTDLVICYNHKVPNFLIARAIPYPLPMIIRTTLNVQKYSKVI